MLINITLRPESDIYLFPIGLGYIATSIHDAGFVMEILDIDALRLSEKEIEKYIQNAHFDVAAMGCIVTGYKYVKKYCEIIKKYKKVPIIIGNSVASSIPQILMNKTKADIGVIGEGDITIVELLNSIKNKTPLENVKGIFFKKDGKIIFTEKRKPIENLDELPLINYDLFKMDLYIEKGKLSVPEPYPIALEKIKPFPFNTARGCPFACTFCYHIFKDVKYRTRSIEHIYKEIKVLKEKYGINYLLFWDELSISTKKRASQLADLFIKENLNIYWIADCRAGLFKDNDEDLELAKKLKRAGCLSIGYSLENADKEILKAMNKLITVEAFIEQTRVLQKAGLLITTSLVIGYPQETLESIKKTFEVCYECNIYPSTGYLLPQPGTPMYDLAIQMGKIRDEEEYLLSIGDRQDFYINLTKLPQNEIEELVEKCIKRIAKKLNLGLDEKHLIKTGHLRQKSED